MDFVAIDVETANQKRMSICQIGMTINQGGRETSKSWLINPLCDFAPINIGIHGITARHVANAPTLADIWPDLVRMIGNMPLFAHSDFDRQAFTAATNHHGLPLPEWDWRDSIHVASCHWPRLSCYKLKSLIIELNLPRGKHHDAAYDALTVSRLINLAIAKGYKV